MAKKQAVLNSEFNEDNYIAYLEFCQSTGLPYTIKESNYSLYIESEFCNIKFRPEMNKKAFIAGAMIKRDIRNSGLIAPDINPEDLKYFNFSAEDNLQRADSVVYNVDIKSAYASILREHAIISKKTHGYMSRLSKKDRLACVGMLASRKDIFNMVGKVATSSHKELSGYASWFYFCVNRTNEIMRECQLRIGNDFLFFWVDGIFFNGKSNIDVVCKVLNELGYRYSIDTCTNMKLDNDGKRRVLSYNKGEEFKELTLPKKNSEVDSFLINFMYF